MFQNESIANAIYDTPWYFQSCKTNKLILQFLMILARPILTVTVHGIHPLNWNYSTKLLRLIYSTLNLMLAAFK